MSQFFGAAVKNATVINPVRHGKNIIGASKELYNPTAPPVPITPGPPTVDQSLIDREAQDTMRRRRGRAANVIAGDAAVPGASLAVNTLLGGG